MRHFKSLFLCLVILSSFNANALLIKLDFQTSGSTDMWGNTTNNFDISQAFGLSENYATTTNAILDAVREDYYSSSYAFINANQQLDIDFMIAPVGQDVSGIDASHYTIQIGSRVSGPNNGLGVACLGCVSNATAPVNTIFGSIFSNNIFSALTGTAGGSWDLNETVNAIAGTLSHEIGHALGLPHPNGPMTNPGDSIYGLMATGAAPSNMPNSERLKNRAFSDEYMETLVRNIGLRTVSSQPIPEPASFAIFFLAIMILLRSKAPSLFK